MVFGLEGVVEGDDEWVVGGCENFLFREGTLDFVTLDHLLLAEN